MATEKKPTPTIKTQEGPSLLEAWMGYIYGSNGCSKGLAALKFLRDCLSKGILTNQAVWAAASDEIKNNLRHQFGIKDSSDNVLYSLRNALVYAQQAKQPEAIKAVQASIDAVTASAAKAISNRNPVVSISSGKAIIRFPKPTK